MNNKRLKRKLHIILFCKNASLTSCFVLSLNQIYKPGIPVTKLAVELLAEESFLCFCFPIVSVTGKPKCHTNSNFVLYFCFHIN